MTLTASASARLRQAYHDLLLWGIYARERRIETSPAESLHQFAMERVRLIQALLAEAGVERNQPLSMAWFRDTERLLVAYFDVAARSQYSEAWPSLQRQFYGHERLGQEVLERVEILAQSPISPEAPVEALEVFERCLRIGYHGGAIERSLHPDLLDRFASKLVEAQHRPMPALAPRLPKLMLRQSWIPQVGPLGIVGLALALLLVWAAGTLLCLSSQASGVETSLQEALKEHKEYCPSGLTAK